MQIGTDIAFAAELLTDNKLVAIPTETVYGLAANAFNTSAVLNIYKTKNRPQFNPLIIHSNSLLRFENWGLTIPAEAKKLSTHFWPGPLTLVVKANEYIPDVVTAGTGAVAIRVPNHPLTLQLLALLDFPLAAPSANPSGFVSPTSALHVAKNLGNKIDYILDGGNCAVGLESTIVSFLEEEPMVLRFGGLAIEEIEAVLGKKVAVANKDNKVVAPGMLTKHYAPNHKLVVVDDLQQAYLAYNKNRVGIISFSSFIGDVPAAHQFVLSENNNLEEAASNLFAAMQQIDELDLDIILAERFPNKGLGFAINDRLKRASIQ
ncbi:MAG: L-threonylcarbamoyladenylate synthase [Bacteroidota bacterium]